MDFIYELLGELVSEVLVPALLLVAVVILAMPIYFILKKLSGRKTTFREDVWEAFFTPAAMRPPSPLVQELDGVRSGLETVGVYLLYSAIALVTGFIFYFFVKLPHDPNRAFLEVFFGVGYLVFMLFAVGQVFALKSRRRAHGANRRAVTTEFSFQFGAPPAGGSGPQVRMEFSVPELEDKVDDAALDKAESYLAIGEGLETICRHINPRFADWRRPQQEAYKAYLQKALEVRNSRHGEAAQPIASTAPPLEVYKPAPPSTILGLTRAQLMVAGVVFVTAFATFLSILIVMSRSGR